MQITRPAYYDRFRCLAGECPDSCCKEWDIEVDRDSAAFYCALPGALGERLRNSLKEEDGETFLTMENGRCPMWRADGLCRIQAELGEAALCHTCRDFPRLRHDYGDFMELQLELSCPEAARWILSPEAAASIAETVSGGTEPDYDREAMEILLRTRSAAHTLLNDTNRPIPETLTLLLLCGCQAQGELDGGEAFPFRPEEALEEALRMACPGNVADVIEFFAGLERLTSRWDHRLRDPAPGIWKREHLSLARYFVDRYWLQAVSDYDLYSRVKFAVLSCLLIRELGGDTISTAQLYSKEIENDVDNLEAVLDAAYTHPAFTDAKLLGMLLA